MAGDPNMIPTSHHHTQEGQSGSKAIYIAICKAAEAPDPDGLLALLTSPEGRAVPRGWRLPEQLAVVEGHTDCLFVLQRCGYTLDNTTWDGAVGYGHVQCLEFAVCQNHPLDDNVFNTAMLSGERACVAFLLQQGLPRTPYLPTHFPLTRDQLTCVELMLDKGAPLDPETLLRAAGHGDADCVRALHKRGVPLWHSICHKRRSSGRLQCKVTEPSALTIFRRPNDLEAIFEAMRYASLHGAPVLPPLQELFRRKQQCTHALLRCFKAADRQSKRPGASGALASMAAVPKELVEIIIVLAELEISEIVKRPRPALHSAPARAQ